MTQSGWSTHRQFQVESRLLTWGQQDVNGPADMHASSVSLLQRGNLTRKIAPSTIEPWCPAMNTTLASSGKKFALILVAAASLSGCAGMGSGYETPTVSVQSFRPVATASGGGLPTFEILLHVVNPNLEPLELAGISYTISLDNHDLIKGVGNDLPIIEGYGEGSFTVTAGFNVIAGIQLFRSLMQKDTDSFDYSFDAKLDPGAYKRKIRVSDSGSISLSNK